tara:strand:+ start:1095 stop:1265 length:171 start_codon:yes stop_codon:yes gene_type:complete
MNFSNSYVEDVASAMELFKPKTCELPRAPQKNRKKQPVHPGGPITIFEHAVSDATL